MKKKLLTLALFGAIASAAAQQAVVTAPSGLIRTETTVSYDNVVRLDAETADYLADTYNWGGEAITASTVSDPSESGAQGLIRLWNGNFAVYRNFDFGGTASKVVVRKERPRDSKMEIWIDRTIDESAKTMTGGTLLGTVYFQSGNTGWGKWNDYEQTISSVSGVHDVTLVFYPAGSTADNQQFGGLNYVDFYTSDSEPLVSGMYTRATQRYASLSVNGVDVPIINGADTDNRRDFLDYDVALFTATEGRCTARLTTVGTLNSISISPLMLEIPVTRVNASTVEFDVPDPATTPYYIVATVNGRRLVICRDTPTAAPTGDGVFSVADELAADGLNATLMANAKAVAAAFQRAVDEASSWGTAHEGQRGEVVVPDGLYYVANVVLKSNMNLYVAPSAVLRFTDNKEDYDVFFHKTSMGNRPGTWWFYTEEGTKNLKIYGNGIFDGNGYYLNKQAASDRRFCSNVFTILQAENVEMDGITVLQAGFWGTIPARTNDMTITNVKFLNSMDASENDGIDVCESQHVRIDRSIGIALDDPYSCKTWAGQEIFSLWPGEPEQLTDVVFDHCVSLTYCGAFKMGHGAQQLQTDITVRNSVVLGSGRALGVEPRYPNPNGQPIGGMRGITFENIDIEGAGGEGWFKAEVVAQNVGIPPAADVTLRNINIRSRGTGAKIVGCDENNQIEGVTFENIYLFGNTEPVYSLAELGITEVAFATGVGFNPDHSRDATHLIEAEYANQTNGANMAANNGSDADHPAGQIMQDMSAGSWLRFMQADLGSHTLRAAVRALPSRAGATFELRLDAADGTLIGSGSSTGSGAWETITIDLSDEARGIHDLYLVATTAFGAVNYVELLDRSFVDLTAIAPAEAELTVNVDLTAQPEVVFTPADAFNQTLTWSIVSAEPEACITLDKETGLILGKAVGSAVVRATSVANPALTADFAVSVVAEQEFLTLRIEAESADYLADTYHYDSGISKGSVNDPDESGAQGLNSCWHGNFAVYRDVDFGAGAVKATFRKGYPRGSALQLWVDCSIDESAKTMIGGTMIAEIEFPNPGSTDWTRWQTFETPITELVQGTHDLVVLFQAGGGSATNQNFGALNWIELTLIDAPYEENYADRITAQVLPAIQTAGRFWGLRQSVVDELWDDAYTTSCDRETYQTLLAAVNNPENTYVPESGYYRLLTVRPDFNNLLGQTTDVVYGNLAADDLSAVTVLRFERDAADRYAIALQGAYLQAPTQSNRIGRGAEPVYFTPIVKSQPTATADAQIALQGDASVAFSCIHRRTNNDGGDIVGWEQTDSKSSWYLLRAETIDFPLHALEGNSYATLYVPFAVSLPEGLTAYATQVNGDRARLSSLGTEVPAATPVLIIAEGEQTMATATILADDIAPASVANDLRGAYLQTSLAETDLVLGQKDGRIGFFKSTQTLGANRAYLPVSAAMAVKGVTFSNLVVGVAENQIVDCKSVNSKCYDLSGRRVEQGARLRSGVYVRDGRKVVIR